MSTDVSSVTNHFPDCENGFYTTTTATVSAGAATVPINITGGYTNGKPVVFVIEPGEDNQQTFTGLIDTVAKQVTSVVWTAGANISHASGSAVVDYASATHLNMMNKGILVEHNQDGTHAAVTTDSSVTADTLRLTSTTDATVSSTAHAFQIGADNTNNMIIDPNEIMARANGAATTMNLNVDGGNITLGSATSVIYVNGTMAGGGFGAWQSYSPTWTNLTVGSGTNYCRFTQIGKTVFVRGYVLFAADSSISGGVTWTAPTTLASHGKSTIVGNASFYDDSTATFYDGPLYHITSSTLVGAVVWNAGSTYLGRTALSSSVPFTWATNDILIYQYVYEAA